MTAEWNAAWNAAMEAKNFSWCVTELARIAMVERGYVVVGFVPGQPALEPGRSIAEFSGYPLLAGLQLEALSQTNRRDWIVQRVTFARIVEIQDDNPPHGNRYYRCELKTAFVENKEKKLPNGHVRAVSAEAGV